MMMVMYLILEAEGDEPPFIYTSNTILSLT